MEILARTVTFLIVAASPLPLFAWALLATEARQRLGVVDRLVLAAIYWCVHLTLTALLLGFTRHLEIRSLLLLSIASWLPLVGLVRRPEARSRVLSVLQDTSQAVSRHKVICLAYLALIAAFFYGITTTAVTNYDSQAYHIPFVYEWIQQQGFVVHSQWQGNPIGYYPSNWEALCALMYLAFGGDLLLRFPNLIVLILWIVATYGIARRSGASPAAAAGLSLALGTMPIVAENILALHVDLALASFFAAAIYIAMARLARSSVTWAAACFACLGMMCGIKPSGLVYAVLALALLVANGAFGGSRPRRAALVSLVISLALLVALGASWYCRNLLLCGNPFGVVRALPGRAVLSNGPVWGHLFQTSLLAVADWTNPIHYRLLVRVFVVRCGIPFWILVGAGCVGYGLAVFRGLRPPLAVVGVLVLTWLLYLATPYSGESGTHGHRLTSWFAQAIRYGFPFLGALAAVAAIGFGKNVVAGFCVLLVGLILVGSQLLQTPPVWVAGCAACAAIVLAARRFSRPSLSLGLRSPAGACVLAGLGVIAASLVLHRLDLERAANVPEPWKEVRRVLDESGVTRLAYTRSHTGHLWYGNELRIRPTYVEASDAGGYEREMRRLGLEVLAIGPSATSASDGPAALSSLARDSRFTLLYGDLTKPGFVLLRLRNATSRGAGAARSDSRWCSSGMSGDRLDSLSPRDRECLGSVERG